MPYFTLKILRSSPRRHRGERTTTIPMNTPPLPLNLPFTAVSSYAEVGKVCLTKWEKCVILKCCACHPRDQEVNHSRSKPLSSMNCSTAAGSALLSSKGRVNRAWGPSKLSAKEMVPSSVIVKISGSGSLPW